MGYCNLKNNATFGVIGAMESEVALLREALADRETAELYGLTFYSGRLGGSRVVLVQCGVGKVNAARCTQILIDRFAPDYIINTGIAGGVGEGLAIADVVIGTELVQHDFDISFFGHARGYLATGVDHDKPTVFHSDPELVKAFRAAAAALVEPQRVKEGRIASGDQFITLPEVKRDLAETFGATAAEMEGCAIAQVAACAGVPFIVIRAISDLADGSAAAKFEVFDKEAADLSASTLLAMIRG